MFVPTILPHEGLVAPISPEAPPGIDLRLVSDEIDEIIKAGRADKDVSQGEWVTKEGPRVADWSKVIALSVDVITKKSKDLVVAARLTEALLVRHSMAGFREGLWLLRELLERYWDGLYPSLEDGDVEYRAQPFVWLNDQVAWRIGEITPPEEYLPLAELEAAEATATGCREEFLALYQAIEQRYGRDVPRVGKLHDAIEQYAETVTEIAARKRAIEAPPPSETDATSDSPASPRRAASGEEPLDRADGLRRLRQIAVYLRKNDPLSPLSYRLARVAQWADGKLDEATPPAQSDRAAPPTETRTTLLGLYEDGSWTELLDACEDSLATPAGRFWLDPQYYTVAALEQLGDSYAPCLEAVKDEVRRYVSDFPSLPKLYLNDFTAAASPETQTWLATAIVLPETIPVAAPASNGSEETVDPWREAQLRAHAGQKAEALHLLRSEILRAPSGREAFTWKLRLAELCIAERMANLAVPLLEELAEQIDRFHLEEWEPRELSARVFAALYQCCKQDRNGIGEARARESFARLCRLDVSRAFRDGNA